MKYLLFGIILCLLSACSIIDKAFENNQNAVIIKSESALVTYEHPSVCEDCIYSKPAAEPGECHRCGNSTESSSYKLCTKCAVKTNTCAICPAPLDIATYLNDLEFSLATEKKPEMEIAYINHQTKRHPGCCSKHKSVVCTWALSNCRSCGTTVASGVYKLCVSCAISTQTCRLCMGSLNN